MKAFFTIILLMIAATGICQCEYTYENKGVNIFLEAEGNANLDLGMGGVAFTIGYQFNPHFFLGGGLANKYIGERDIKRKEVRTLGWYDASTNTYHSDYYIDEKGERRKIYDNANGDGDHSIYFNDCGEDDCRMVDPSLDVYVDFRYNFLDKTRYTPYINFRTGVYFNTFGTCGFDEMIVGCRFGCGEGDFAIVGGAGWSFRNIRDDDYSYNKHFLTLKLGVEF